MLAIGLFLSSLNDFYIPALSGAPLPVLGLGLILLGCRRLNAWRGLEIAFAAVVLIGLVVGLYRLSVPPEATLTLSQTAGVPVGVALKITNVLGWLISLLALLASVHTRRDALVQAIRIYLILHVAMLLVQAAVFAVSGYYPDPFALVGEASRVYGGSLTEETSPLAIRPSGFFQEPSAYAVHVVPMALLLYLLTNRVSWVVLAALVSAALTFSSWAFVAVAASALILMRLTPTALVASLGIGAVLAGFVQWFVTRTFEINYDSGVTPWQLRVDFAGKVIGNALSLSPGFGIGIADTALRDYAINDSGALVFLVYVFGIFALVLLVPLFATVSGLRPRLVLLILLSSKMPPTYPLFWLLINMLSRIQETRTADDPAAEPGTAAAVPATGRVPALPGP